MQLRAAHPYASRRSAVLAGNMVATSQPLAARGWESVTVPGAVSAWVEISERFGDLPFADLFEPAIRYAEEGFSVTPIIAQLWARGGRFLGDQPGFAETFLL